jgi:hypothetical protein
MFVSVIFPMLLQEINGIDPMGWTFTGHAEAYAAIQVAPYVMLTVGIFVGLAFIFGRKDD